LGVPQHFPGFRGGYSATPSGFSPTRSDVANAAAGVLVMVKTAPSPILFSKEGLARVSMPLRGARGWRRLGDDDRACERASMQRGR
jgi:hypothetical protein